MVIFHIIIAYFRVKNEILSQDIRYYSDFSLSLQSKLIDMDKKLNRIKVVLWDKDMSQKDLALRLGKSFSTVNAYCCNRQQPTLDVLNRIAEILNVDVQELIDGYKKVTTFEHQQN